MSERVYISFDRHEDSEALRDAMRATRYKIFIDEFDQRVFRSIIKYGHIDEFDVSSLDPATADPYKIELLEKFAETFRKKYWELFDEVVRDEI